MAPAAVVAVEQVRAAAAVAGSLVGGPVYYVGAAAAAVGAAVRELGAAVVVEGEVGAACGALPGAAALTTVLGGLLWRQEAQTLTCASAAGAASAAAALEWRC